MDKLYVAIPAYNEESNIEATAREWHKVASRIGKTSRIVIIDDGSKDKTYAKLKELQKELIQLQAISKPNEGHGATILYGYRYALESGANYVFQTDSDEQTLPSEFWQFWENRKYFDIQIGFRNKRQDGFSRILVTKILKVILFLQFRLWIADANAPFRLMSADLLREIVIRIPKSHNLANVLLTVLYHKNKRVKYHPITFRPRQDRVDSINLKRIIKIGQKTIRDLKSFNVTIQTREENR